MNRGQLLPIRINARYEMNGANNYFKTFLKPHFSQILGQPRADIDDSNTKMYRGQEPHPINANVRKNMN